MTEQRSAVSTPLAAMLALGLLALVPLSFVFTWAGAWHAAVLVTGGHDSVVAFANDHDASVGLTAAALTLAPALPKTTPLEPNEQSNPPCEFGQKPARH